MKKIAGIENTLFCLCDRNKYYGIIEVLGNDIILKTTSLKHANLYFKAEACMILKKLRQNGILAVMATEKEAGKRVGLISVSTEKTKKRRKKDTETTQINIVKSIVVNH